MAWFNFLKTEGYFAPDKNPEPFPVKDGFQVPYWDALSYLEKLSLQIKEGKELELIDEILLVIKNVSENPKDNYRTWYLFIKILNNLPNDKITKEILDFVPIWLSGRFSSSLQSSELCEKLLSKFLNDESTEKDIEKAELILHYLFQVEKAEIDPNDIWDIENVSYRSKVHLYYLSSAFKKQNLTEKVVKYCSNNFILELAKTLKKLLLDYPNGINTNLKDGKKEYVIKIFIDNTNLLVSLKLKKSKVANQIFTIKNFEDLNENEIKQKLVENFKSKKINYTPTDNEFDVFKRLIFALNNDLISEFGLNPISDLGDKYTNNEKVLNVFSLIFRDLIDEKAKQNSIEAISLLKTICYDKNYSIPFYKRIVLYVIGENWNNTKDVFWELVKGKDALHLFSKHKYYKELYRLLSKNQQLLTSSEKIILQEIIDNGEQGEFNEKNVKQIEYWELRWYSALKDIPPFNEMYLQISKRLNITSNHYENLGKVSLRSGSVSPITKDDLLQKSNKEITEMLYSFHPDNSWEGSNISGLSDTLGVAVEVEPKKFANEIELYKDVSYIYSYRLINAFGEAWKKQKSFNWEKVLIFCLDYIKDKKFYSNQLQEQNDGWGANADWVVGSIANLLTIGMQKEENSFDIQLMPIAKQIIKILTINLEPIDIIKDRKNTDYLSYSFNSVAGKTLRALLDYSLRKARTLNEKVEEKWEPEMKSLFVKTLEKDILDGHILEGMYFEQFYYLDKNWIIDQVKKHYDSSEREWLAFMGSFIFVNPPFNKELYDLFYPLYDNAILNNLELKHFGSPGLIKHLTAFYFWGYEDLSETTLISKFLNTTSTNNISELISFLWQQENYQNGLTEIERIDFEKKIFKLWNFITNKYKDAKNEEEQNILAMLSHLIVFVPQLNDKYTKLLLVSGRYVHKNYYTHELIKHLVLLKDKGTVLITAKSIGEIISSIEFNEYIDKFDQANIIDLVSFLFENGQKESAVNLSNKMAIQHQYFLREVYEKYTLE